MKAISIKEPWSSLIRQGKKSIETRTWKTKYRGDLLLCCSKNPNISNICGMAFAIAELVDVRDMTKEDEYLARCERYPKAKSWVFKNIRIIDPFPVVGKLMLFDVELPIT